MAERHGAETIKGWIQDLVERARSGREVRTSGGAEPDRDYAYLEYHLSGDEHSILLFTLDEEGERPKVRAIRIDGTAVEVREKVDDLTHPDRES